MKEKGTKRMASKLGTHQTMDPETARSVEWLDQRPEVRKIVLSHHLVRSHSRTPGFLSVREVSNGVVRVTAYGGAGLRDLLVHTDNPKLVAQLVEKRWPREGKAITATAIAEKLKAALQEPPAKVEAAAPTTTKVEYKPHVEPESLKVPDPKRGLFDGAPVTTGVVVELRIITPEIAEFWLSKNTRNRPLSQGVVDRYAADMLAGKWGISESVIAFDERENILNGQHRLWAVFQSGATIKALVATGYPTDAITYFDDGFARDVATVYNLTHEGNVSKRTMAIARRLMGSGWRSGGGSGPKSSRQEIFVIVEKHREAIAYAEKLWGSAMRGVSVGAVATVIARAYYTADRQRLDEFLDVLKTGLSKGTQDNAAVLLRDWLVKNGVNNQRAQEQSYWKTERALLAFLDRDPITRLYAAEKELFPLPE